MAADNQRRSPNIDHLMLGRLREALPEASEAQIQRLFDEAKELGRQLRDARGDGGTDG